MWFTDPGYGIMSNYEGDQAELELPTRVYRLDPDSGVLEVVIESLDRPNGLCFSPQRVPALRRRLRVPTPTIHVFDMSSGRPTDGRVFVDMSPGTSDGIRCDVDGNLWAAAAGGGDGYDGVHVFAPDGIRIGPIAAARAVREHLLRRPAQQPAVHGCRSVDLLAVHQHRSGSPGG